MWIFGKNCPSVGTVFHKNTYSDYSVVENICAKTMKRYGYFRTESETSDTVKPESVKSSPVKAVV